MIGFALRLLQVIHKYFLIQSTELHHSSMGTAFGVAGASPKTVSDEERGWLIIGICLTKVLTPALKDVLANEMPIWYQNLLLPPYQIDKQTSAGHAKMLPPSKLNYESVNNNYTICKTSSYDYMVSKIQYLWRSCS